MTAHREDPFEKPTGTYTMQYSITCPSCQSSLMDVFHEVKSVPSNSCILLQTREEAVNYPTGDIRLGFCKQCGFISNVAFNSELTEYSGRYEETQGFSDIFNEFHKNLAARLIDRYDLHGKNILEIGCGKGEFLLMLCEMGGNIGVGFDPGFVEDRVQNNDMALRTTFIKDFYYEKYTAYQGDFVCCKMTLEHIHPTAEFIGTVRRSIGDRADTIVFFQIPDVTRILRDCAFEDVYYEHCSYFSPGSLGRLFRQCGFDVLDIATEYGDQYLTIEARPSIDSEKMPHPNENDLDLISTYVEQFPTKFQEKKMQWEQRLADYKNQGKKVVLWGSGSKGVSFLTTLNLADSIDYVVDINPYRQGYFMSGTGQEIISPDFLNQYDPDVVIIMNPIYRDEIATSLLQRGLHPELLTL